MGDNVVDRKNTARRSRVLAALLTVLALVLAACGGGAEEPVDDPEATGEPAATETDTEDADTGDDPVAMLEGETIELVAPYGPGGSYDRNARALQPYLEEHSGATVVVMNEPGAGSLLATNRTYTTPPSDNRIQLVNTIGVIAATLGGAEGVNFDLGEFTWVGGISAEPEVLVVSPNGDVPTLDALLARADGDEPLRFGATGPGDNFWINALIMREVFDLPVEVVSGFESAPELYQAVARGDVDVAVGSLTSTMPLVDGGELAALTYFGEPPSGYPSIDAVLGDVPPLEEVAADAGVDEQTLNDYLGPYSVVLGINRVLAAPPETPDDKLAAYRTAFDAATSDQEFLDAATEQGLFIVPTSGSEVADLMDQVLDAPQPFVDLVRSSFSG